ncbi:MAG TPA: class I SAM-dependent methyltransferase [Bryobacteraceae bacterium]|nr:class I SAM-dependent methyltransferase [Bryobacteraceae bacterium]
MADVPRKGSESLSLEERIILSFARDPGAAEIGATASYSVDNCLDFPLKTVPDLAERIRGRKVLDFGCGFGWQAVALKKLGAAEVWGIDIVERYLTSARELARKNAVDVHFVSSIPKDVLGSFDVVLSISAFEHFSDPEAMVRLMGSYVADSGEIIITWAEPWYSHSGSHFGNFTKIPGTNLAIPWCNLFFSDRAMLTLRTRFRNDRPARVEDIEGGLNRMTVARFERIMRQSGMTIERLKLHATVGLPLVTKVPVIRELLTSAATCILRREPKNRLSS